MQARGPAATGWAFLWDSGRRTRPVTRRGLWPLGEGWGELSGGGGASRGAGSGKRSCPPSPTPIPTPPAPPGAPRQSEGREPSVLGTLAVSRAAAGVASRAVTPAAGCTGLARANMPAAAVWLLWQPLANRSSWGGMAPGFQGHASLTSDPGTRGPGGAFPCPGRTAGWGRAGWTFTLREASS